MNRNKLFESILQESAQRFVVLGPYDEDGADIAGTVDSEEKALKLGRLFLTSKGYCTEEDLREPEGMSNGDWLMTDPDFDCDGRSGAHITILPIVGNGSYVILGDDGDSFFIVGDKAYPSSESAAEGLAESDPEAEQDEDDEDVWYADDVTYEIVGINKVMQEMV